MTTDEKELLETLTPAAAPVMSRLDTATWFDREHANTECSPIDEFVINLYAINRIYLGAEAREEYSPMLGSLVYLGMVSAAESYFRSLLRRLILTDHVCISNASNRMVSYGAVLHHTDDLLPEALLEGISLASKKMLLANFEHYAASLKWVKTAVSRTIFNCSLKISNLFVKLGIVEFTDSENWAVNKR